MGNLNIKENKMHVLAKLHSMICILGENCTPFADFIF